MQKLLLTAFLFFAIVCSAQDTVSNKKPGFYVEASTGLAAGESGVFSIVKLAGGIHINKWHAGAGFNYDTYRFKSLAFVGSVKYHLAKKIFLYSDVGYNRVLEKYPKENFNTTHEFSGGLYFNTGVGLQFRAGKKNSFLISSGFSHKRVNNKVGYTYPCLVAPCPENIYDYKYNLGRLVISIGWQFQSVK